MVKCSGVLQCIDGLNNKVSNITRRLMDNMFCLYVFYEYYYHNIFLIKVYLVLFLFNNIIYIFLLLRLCILTVCLYMTTLTEFCPCFFLSCKANARVKPTKTGHCPHSS